MGGGSSKSPGVPKTGVSLTVGLAGIGASDRGGPYAETEFSRFIPLLFLPISKEAPSPKSEWSSDSHLRELVDSTDGLLRISLVGNSLVLDETVRMV